MKQTNNAIKFLMAQYRAIFKNANIAMVAAMAAAALAAGQAQAATDEWANLSGAEVIGSSDNKEYSSTGGENANGFELTINGGSLTIAGTDSADGSFTVEASKSGEILQTGGKFAIGLANKSGGVVSIDTYKITGGELVLGDSKAKSVSKLNAKTITIGSLSSAAADPPEFIKTL